MYLRFLAILVALTVSVNCGAQGKQVETIKSALKVIFQDIEVDRVEPSEIPGLYLVTVGVLRSSILRSRAMARTR